MMCEYPSMQCECLLLALMVKRFDFHYESAYGELELVVEASFDDCLKQMSNEIELKSQILK